MAHESTRTTGGDPVAGADPGGTRSTRPGRPAGKGEREAAQRTVSGDRNAGRPEDLARDPQPLEKG
ncbi:MAG: hypothetical protein JO326_07465 [Acetobacteraceae bacterium]|nr:hypothetical protein [Acetobacteraceae bacterium]